MNELAKMGDEQLVYLAQHDNQQAKDTLYYRYRGVVLMRARSFFLLGADKEDLFQEGIWGLLNAIARYDPTQNMRFSNYVKLSVNAAIYTAIKKAASDRNLPLNTYVSIYSAVSSEHTDTQLLEMLEDENAASPEELVMREYETDEFFAKAKHILSRLEMDVLTLFIEGCSYKEISDKIGRSTKCVDNSLQRIRDKFTCMLRKKNS